jgi:copper chaperone
MTTKTYDVPDVSCGHCVAAITAEVASLPGVERVEVDLEHGRVAVTGSSLEDAAIRIAIYEAGYEAVIV